VPLNLLLEMLINNTSTTTNICSSKARAIFNFFKIIHLTCTYTLGSQTAGKSNYRDYREKRQIFLAPSSYNNDLRNGIVKHCLSGWFNQDYIESPVSDFKVKRSNNRIYHQLVYCLHASSSSHVQTICLKRLEELFPLTHRAAIGVKNLGFFWVWF